MLPPEILKTPSPSIVSPEGRVEELCLFDNTGHKIESVDVAVTLDNEFVAPICDLTFV